MFILGKLKRVILNMMYTWTEFEQKLIIHRDTSIDISRILLMYENQIKEIIEKIKKLKFEETASIFDELCEIQDYLATAKYKYDIELNKELDLFVYHFDRAEDEYIKQYWYEQFHNNITWPLPEDS